MSDFSLTLAMAPINEMDLLGRVSNPRHEKACKRYYPIMTQNFDINISMLYNSLKQSKSTNIFLYIIFSHIIICKT